MANSDSSPAMVVTMAMTIASRGRSTKMDDSIGSTPVADLGHVRGAHRRAGAQALQALDDDQIARLQPAVDGNVRPDLACRLDPPDRRLAVLDDEHVGALLV